ncbi:MAG TPA: amino acid permease, partial [Gemmatimonadales bacterium]|nr:amino acid permease [Gemmatimonadales bacterium]
MTQLRRAIRLPHATALVVGTIIGASIFVQPSEITGAVPSVPGVLLVWAVAGALTIAGALVSAELASAYTRSGGVYVYLREAFHPALGFLWGWAMFWVMHSGIIAAIAMIFARYLGYFTPLGDWGVKLVAIGVICLISVINYVGVRPGSVLQTAFTAGKVAAVLAIVALGFALGGRAPEHFQGPTADAAVSLRGLFTGLVAGLFAFGGWHMVTYNADETVDPARTIPRALIIGTAIVTLCYVGMNVVYFFVLPFDRVAASTRVAADAADAVLGSGGGAILSGVVLFSTFGALLGIVLTGPRVYYAMANDGLLFAWAGTVHPRFRTPHLAIALQALWSATLVATGTYRALFTRVVYTEWIFFGTMALGLILLRRRGLTPPYRAPGFPAVPALFALASFAIVVNQIVSDPGESLVGLSLVVAGLPVYVFGFGGRAGRVA